MLKEFSRQDCRKLGRAEVRELPLFTHFYEAVDKGDVKVLGITDAKNVGAMGMCHYLLWRGISGKLYASYITELQKKCL